MQQTAVVDDAHYHLLVGLLVFSVVPEDLLELLRPAALDDVLSNTLVHFGADLPLETGRIMLVQDIHDHIS